MEFRTGYFAKMNKYVEQGYYPISIARFNPKGIKLMQWIRIAPNQDILQGYKSGQLDELDYEMKYRLQLQNADVIGDWEKMLEIVGNLKKDYKGIVFLCYEKSGSFCHRHIFANYMKEKYNIGITELEL